ncbi:MAG: homoserine kinase [Thermoactinomycetaceae bacterium]|jgi:homoserine kinase|nr:homoserine kinase [Bacillota bacterium]MBO2533281.1 homoserine kinase [Thermoactinomycetaceae bacterium]
MAPFDDFEVVVPASTANMGPGFDSLGMALNLFLRLRFSHQDRMEIVLRGDQWKGVPADGRNLVIRVMREAFRRMGRKLPPFRLEMESDIPLMRGLGSSAAAVVGGLLAANHLLGGPFSKEEILLEATRREGHPDNAAASLFGGVVICSWDGERVYHVQGDPPPLHVVTAVPSFSLSTEQARKVLPKSLPHPLAVLASSRANLLTAALLTGKWELLEVAMEDWFHQPYRFPLVPGMEEVLADSRRHGALGVALSGAGPTLIAFTREPERVGRFMKGVFARHGISVRILSLLPFAEGATVRLTIGMGRSKFMGNTEGVET